jgi:hypothetical protein
MTIAAPTITRSSFQESDSYDPFSQSRPNTNLCRPSLVKRKGLPGFKVGSDWRFTSRVLRSGRQHSTPGGEGQALKV